MGCLGFHAAVADASTCVCGHSIVRHTPPQVVSEFYDPTMLHSFALRTAEECLEAFAADFLREHASFQCPLRIEQLSRASSLAAPFSASVRAVLHHLDVCQGHGARWTNLFHNAMQPPIAVGAEPSPAPLQPASSDEDSHSGIAERPPFSLPGRAHFPRSTMLMPDRSNDQVSKQTRHVCRARDARRWLRDRSIDAAMASALIMSQTHALSPVCVSLCQSKRLLHRLALIHGYRSKIVKLDGQVRELEAGEKENPVKQPLQAS